MNGEQPQIVATVSHYNEMIAAIRNRVDELGVSLATVEDLAGLQDGYASKLFAASGATKHMSIFTQFLVLDALGVSLSLVVDPVKLARVQGRLNKRKRETTHVRRALRIVQLTPDWMRQIARKGGEAYVRNHTPAQRSASARHAVEVRWRKQREREREQRERRKRPRARRINGHAAVQATAI